MNARHDIPQETSEKQELVSDPKVSAWVSANAGSGKTTVLVRRVIRLLLRGAPPAKILCLTFTKAAAANMANKVLGTLAGWVRLDDDALDKKLAGITPEKPSPALRARARRLFAAALETPGGLKVQTIHAFCDRVLHQFPFEAKVPAGFEVLDDVREADLLRRARESVLIEAAGDPEGTLGKALATVVAAASDDSFDKALMEAVQARRQLKELGSEKIAAALGLSPAETVACVLDEILGGSILKRSEWAPIAGALDPHEGNARQCANRLRKADAARDDADRVQCYFDVFFTQKGEPRKDKGGFGSAGAIKSEPGIFNRIFSERDRLIPLRDKLFAAQALERTSALLTLAQAAIARFETQKHERGALDYTDLIEKTADMLNDKGSEWVLYKLDGGIDHVLIDEAQDTSPEQWSVIAKLTEEFFAGKGARGDFQRTIFAVGDDKQSIFSFQGAEPKQFAAMKTRFMTRVSAAGFQFRDERLKHSFRSALMLVEAFDAVFKREQAYQGLSSSDEKNPVHEAIRRTAPALVEIWDTEKPGQDDDASLAWDAPLNATGEASPTVRLAKRIARAVGSWTSGGLAIEDRTTGELRTPNAGDVIVLVRRRGPLFEAILQELKSQGVNVAGADRLKLTEHIAVMDLMALGEALLLEADDFSFACALKSPLFGFDDTNDLFPLAHKRAGTLMASLNDRAEKNTRHAEALSRFARWRREAASLRPFDFYSRVLGRDRGREMMLARLGHEAADAIDEFLAGALAYEQLETPSLTGFLNFLRRAGTEVKRDLEVESAAVRVMTVHGAKGLEAPLIVLADTTTIPDGRHARLHDLPGGAFVWTGRKEFDSAREQAARQAAKDASDAEYRRLLYVALTRAADALIVCGAEGRNMEDGCWYRLVRDALGGEQPSELVESVTNYGNVLRWRPQKTGKPALRVTAATKSVEIPEALKRDAPVSKAGTNRIRPSDFDREDLSKAEHAKSATRLDALKRGDLLHRLLQFLPELPEAERAARAENFLQSSAAGLTENDRSKLAAEALALLSHPGMSALQGAKSLPEVSFLAREPRKNAEIGGRIDRIFEKGNEIIIVDYKTDANPPKTAEQVPERYHRQLRLYREAMGRIYPDKTIRTLLVYSTGPLVHELAS